MDAPPAYSEVTRPLSMPWRVAWLLIPQAAPTEWLPRPSRSRFNIRRRDRCSIQKTA
jgi:hypothetical protein